LSTHGETLKIFRSQNGEIWDLLQEITTTGWTHSSANLSVGLDTFSSEDPSQSERLYLSAWFRDFDPWVDRNTRWELFISTKDGQSWLDHGSTIENVAEGTFSAWNPLNLEEGDLSQSRGDFFDRDFTSGAYSLVSFPREGILQFHNGQNWIQIFSSSPKRTSKNNLAVWGNISFLDELGTGNPNLVTLFKSGEVQVTAPPIEDASFWGGWTNLNGIYFAIISGNSGMKVLHSSDLVNWSKLPFAVGDSYGRLTFSDGKIASRLNDKLFVWSGLSWSSPVPLVTDSEDIAYNEQTDGWYTLSYAGDEVVITSANDGATFASFIPQTWNEYFTKLDCPDGELLISYGNSAEIAVIFPDSSVFLAHPWEFFGSSAYKFDSVAYFNGWYYFLGKPTVRTKDFVKFEEVPLPADYTLINVSGWNGSLYGFVDGAVFRKPLDRGYLESIEMTHGWLHAEWLGWFQIIDEEKGDIDHLLLGDCWVKQANEQQYWLRTSTLGWIYIYRDWSPWFWRMDDGHWYWLDQDGWPPRAWDYEDQEWEELR
jgi:hypothetical protein